MVAWSDPTCQALPPGSHVRVVLTEATVRVVLTEATVRVVLTEATVRVVLTEATVRVVPVVLSFELISVTLQWSGVNLCNSSPKGGFSICVCVYVPVCVCACVSVVVWERAVCVCIYVCVCVCVCMSVRVHLCFICLLHLLLGSRGSADHISWRENARCRETDPESLRVKQQPKPTVLNSHARDLLSFAPDAFSLNLFIPVRPLTWLGAFRHKKTTTFHSFNLQENFLTQLKAKWRKQYKVPSWLMYFPRFRT